LRFGRKARSRKGARGRRDIQVCNVDSCRQSIELRVLARERRKLRIQFDQGDPDALDPSGECEPRGTYTRTEINRLLACPSRACGCEQDRVMPEAMAMLELAEPQAA